MSTRTSLRSGPLAKLYWLRRRFLVIALSISSSGTVTKRMMQRLKFRGAILDRVLRSNRLEKCSLRVDKSYAGACSAIDKL